MRGERELLETRLIRLYNKRKTISEISRVVGISYDRVRGLLKRLKNQGIIEDRYHKPKHKIGDFVGKFEVLGFGFVDSSKHKYYIVKCWCGRIYKQTLSNLLKINGCKACMYSYRKKPKRNY